MYLEYLSVTMKEYKNRAGVYDISLSCLPKLSYLSLGNFMSGSIFYFETLCPVSIKPTLWILEICVLW